MEPHRLRIQEKIIDTLIVNRVCNNAGDCSRRQVVFISPARKGLAVTVYGITNHEMMAALTATVVKEAAALAPDLQIEAKFLVASKQESLERSFWHRDSRVLELIVKGGNDAQR
jgi:hypothetical protein